MSRITGKLVAWLAACVVGVVVALGALPAPASAMTVDELRTLVPARVGGAKAPLAGPLPTGPIPMLTADAAESYDISDGAITINSGNVDSWNGKTITGSLNQVGNNFPQGASDGATYYRSAICIDGVTVNLTIRDLSIVAIFDNNVGAYKVSPILLLNGATLNLTLEGSNTLIACVGGASICVPDGCGLNIGGSGSLVAKGGDGGASEQLYHCFGGAAIGAEDKPVGSTLNKTGSITINGGTINATGGAAFSNRGGSAGIGGSGHVKGVVTINGGNVTAEGGDCAAGIGGGIAAGGVITINGGTVKAIANTAGSAIGSGAGKVNSTIAINGGNVTANGNIGSPGTASGGSTLAVDFSKAVITCEGNGRVNCRNAAIQTFTVTVYDAALAPGDHACTFWVNEKIVNSAAMPATLSVSEAGVGTATVKGLVSYGDSASMQVTGHLQIGDRTYDTAAVQMSTATTSMNLYSGYRVTLTGTVYDAAIASGQAGTVSVEGVTLASQSVSTSARKAVVLAVFYLAEGAVDDEDLTKNVSVTVGGKTYAAGNVTFAKSATHQKKGSFTVSEGGIDYVKLDGEVAFVSPYNVIETNTTTWTGDKNNGFYAAPAGQCVAINDQVKVSGNVNLVLTDGSTLTAAKGIDMGADSSLTIWQQSEGTGKLVAIARTDETYAPGIGSTSGSNIKIIINGGTVEATGYACPGIGGDSHNLNITINAGIVIAKGSSSGGDGIGSESSTIAINGGTVVATASGIGYAGIWSKSGLITINGGHVTATGTDGGAAIGGEAAWGTGSIAISGGTVVANAVSNSSAAAIGGGSDGSFTSIAISGGDVTANGGKYAAAIGGGIRSKAGSATISITGGTVRANGGDYGAGIGNGWNGQCAITTTLSYDNASSGMSVYASSYKFKSFNSDDVTNTVKLSKAFKDAESGTGFAATHSANLSAIVGKTLVPSESYGVTASTTIEHGTVTASPSRTAKDASVTLTVKPDEGYHLVTGSLKATYAGGEVSLAQDASDPTKYTFTMPAADVTVTAAFTNHEHEFTYSADGATITATCVSSVGDCDLPEHKATLTVSAPTGSLTYDGTAKAATVAGEIPGVTTPEITYAKAGDASFTGTPKDAGTYTASIMAEGATARVQFTIAKAAINPTLSIQDKTYNGNEITYTVENNPGGGQVTSFSWEKENSDKSWSSVSDTPKDAGTYRGTATVAKTENYVGATTTTAEFTISKAALTVTAKPHTITYGDAPANGGVEITGFVNDETQDVLGGTLDYNYSYGQFGDVGNSYTITPKGLTSDNYQIAFVSGTLTVGQKEVGLTWSSTPLTYSGAAQAPTAEATGLVNGDTIGVTVTGAQTRAGTGYTATASGLTGNKAGNYKLPSANSTSFAIAKAPLTVTAKPKAITYGDAPANDGVECSGFVGGENQSVLGGTLAYDYSYTQYGDVGSYTITPKGLTSNNYEISFDTGTLTVGQTEVGLTWANTSLTFNGSSQAPTATATGTVNGDAIGVTVGGAQTDAGMDYIATATGLTGDKAGNYRLPDTTTAAFVIDKAAAQTLADVAVSQVYTVAGVSASVAGKMPADAGQLTYANGTESKTGGVTVSSWDVDGSGNVYATLSSGAAGDAVTLPVTISSTNYADSTVNVVVTLRAKDDAGVGISELPPIPLQYRDTLTLTGSVDNPGANGAWTWTSSDPTVLQITSNGAEATIDALKAGSATITASYESDTTIDTFTTALVTVQPKPITITANDKGIYVGDPVPALDDYKVEWLLVPDVLTTAPTLVYKKDGQVVTPDNTKAGTYDIVPSDANAGDNYSISYAGGTLTISDKGIQTIAAENVRVTYGDTDKSVSASVTDPAEGSGTISYAVKAGSEDYLGVDASTGALTIKKAGTATVVVTAAETPTHARATKEVMVTIDKAAAAPAAVTASDRTYDGTEKPLVGVTGEAVGGDMQYALGTKDAATEPYTTSVPAATDAGTYHVWYKVAGDDNHDDTLPAHVDATIGRRVVTVTAVDKSTAYGAELAGLTYAVSAGTLASESHLQTLGVSASTTATGDSPVGEYPITLAGGEGNANYEVTLANGTYTITRANMSVSAEGYSGTYDGAPHGITVAVEPAGAGATVYYGTEPLTADNYAEAGSATPVTRTDAGTTTVYYYVAAGNHDPQPVSGSKDVFVAQAELAVAADAKEKTYGDDDPALTYRVTGLMGGNDAASVLAGALARTAGEDVGTYAIGQGTLAANGNYSVAFTGASLTIGKRPVTAEVTVEDKVYDGTTAATVGAAVREEDLVAGDDVAIAGLKGTFRTAGAARDKEVDVDSSGAVLSGKGLANYDVTIPATATAAILPRPVTVTADDKSGPYGAEPLPLTYVVEGLLGEDSLDVRLSCEVAKTSVAGAYPIAVQAGDDPNYVVTCVPGTYTVTKAAAKLTKEPEAKTLAWTGRAQELVAPGSAEDGVVEYSLDGTTWSASVPTATDPGAYAVRWRVAGDANHGGVAGTTVSATILAKPTYVVVKGAGASGLDWTMGFKDGLVVTFKRKAEGESKDTTISHFRSVSVDGRELTRDKDYTVREGSVVVTLLPTYLATLAPGRHTLAVAFDDGSAEVEFSVEKAATQDASAGKTDTTNMTNTTWRTTPSASVTTALRATPSATAAATTPRGTSTAATTVQAATLPATGDAAPYAGAAAMAAAGAIALLSGRRRRR